MAAQRSSGTGLYVYGVVEAGGGAAGTDRRGGARLVEAEGLAAVVSEVALDEFGEDVLQERLDDPAWLEEQVRAHDRVLEAFVDRETVVPFRFGTIYGDEAAVRGMLAAHGEALRQAIARIDGRREWGVKVRVDRAEVAQELAAEDAPVTAEQPQGHAYFAAKRRERDAREEAQAFARVTAAAVHEQLAATSDAAREVRTRGSTRDLVLNGAYLVARDREDAFTGAVAALSDELAARGVRFELTGPWPPYSFVGEDGDGP